MDQHERPKAGKKRPLKPAGDSSGADQDAASKKAAQTALTPERSPQKRAPKTKASKRKSSDGDQKKKGADQANFPEKLMQLINDNVDPEYVSWIENEEAISFKTDGFQEHVLDKFFQGLKYDSFVRKLNRWGFRRVTSEGVPPGHVAYYHNSFRKEEQELLKTMGIGKKNDPEVQDLQGYGGEQSMIGSASAAIAAACASSEAGGGRTSLEGAGVYASAGLDRPLLNTALARQQLIGIEDQIGGYPTGLRSAASMPNSTRQESKLEVPSGSLGGTSRADTHQLLLETMLARQRQTDAASLQQRDAVLLESLMAENILLRQSQQQQQQQQQQQRAGLTMPSALSRPRDDDLALKLAALAAQRNALGLTQQPRNLFSQPPNAGLPSELWANPSDSQLGSNAAVEALLRNHLMIPGAANSSLGAGSNNPLSNLHSLGNFQGSLNQSISGNLSARANPAANVNNAHEAMNLDELWRRLLMNRQIDKQGPGQGPQR